MGIDAEILFNKLLTAVGFYVPKPTPAKPNGVDFNLNWFLGPYNETCKTLRSTGGHDALEAFFTELTKAANTPDGSQIAKPDRLELGTTAFVLWKLHKDLGGVRLFGRRTWTGTGAARSGDRLLLGLYTGAEVGPLRLAASAGLVDLGAPSGFPIQLADDSNKTWLGLTVADAATGGPKFPLRSATIEWRPFVAPTAPTASLHGFAYTDQGKVIEDVACELPGQTSWSPRHIADLLAWFLRNWVRYAAYREGAKSPPSPALATRLRDHALPLFGYYAPESTKPAKPIAGLDAGALLNGPAAALEAWARSWVADGQPWPPTPPPRVLEGLVHVMALTGLLDGAPASNPDVARRGSTAVWATKLDPAAPNRPQAGLVVDWDTSTSSIEPIGGGISYREVGWLRLLAAARGVTSFTVGGSAWKLSFELRAGAKLDYRATASAGGSASAGVGLSVSPAWALMIALDADEAWPGLSLSVAGAAVRVDRIAVGFEGEAGLPRPVLKVYGYDPSLISGLVGTVRGALSDSAAIRDAAIRAVQDQIDAELAGNPALAELNALAALVRQVAADPGAWLAAQADALQTQVKGWVDSAIKLGVAEISKLLTVPSPLPSGATWAYDAKLDIGAALEGVGLRASGAISLLGRASSTGGGSAAIEASARAGLALELGLPVASGAVQPGLTVAMDAGLIIGGAANPASSSIAASTVGGVRLAFWTLEAGKRSELLGARLDTSGALHWQIATANVENLATNLKGLVANTVLPLARSMLQSEVDGARSEPGVQVALTSVTRVGGWLLSADPVARLPEIGQELWSLATSAPGLTLPAGITLVKGSLTLPDLRVTTGDDVLVTAGLRGLGLTDIFSQPTATWNDPTGLSAGLYLLARGREGRPLLDETVGIGSASATLVPFGAGAPRGTVTFDNIRLPFGQGGGGLESGLMPKDGANPGFGVEILWDASGPAPTFQVRFRGQVGPVRLPLGIELGPLQVRALNLDFRKDHENQDALFVGPDLALSLSGLEIVPIGFRLEIPFQKLYKPEDWRVGLDGLGIGFQTDAMRIAGLLYKRDGDYRGAATLKIGSFELGAIAGFKTIDGEPSFFAFVFVPVPLGGPPFFFVTGLAGGVGVNRALPEIKHPREIESHAFITAMQGGSIAEVEESLSSLKPERGTFWLAVGVKFVSFGFINGCAILYVKINPRRFELRLLALAKMSLASIVNIELAIDGGLIIDEDPTLFVKAELTKNSWLFSTDCKLTGGFAFQVWPKRGDAVLTLGGYHPRFAKPAHYPEVPRLGFHWALGGALVLKGEAYFALTPRAIMAGGRLEVRGSWGPLQAWLIAFLDAFVSWDPWYFDIGIGVEVGISLDTGFFGRISLSLGVELLLHGPPVGGHAVVKVCGMSFRLPIGEQGTPAKLRPTFEQFLQKHLALATTAGGGARVAPDLHTPEGGKLERRLKISVERGLLRPGGAGGKAADPDTVTGPIDLLPEFRLEVRAPMPVTQGAYRERAGAVEDPTLITVNALTGEASFYAEPAAVPIGRSVIELSMSTPSAATATDSQRPSLALLPVEKLPWALWGIPSASTGNQEPTSGEQTVALHPGLRLDATARLGTGHFVAMKPQYSTKSPGWSHALPLALSTAADPYHPVLVVATMAPATPVTHQALAELNTAFAAELARRGASLPRPVVPLARLARPTRGASERVVPLAASTRVRAVATRAAVPTRLAAQKVTGALGVENTGLRSTVEGWASAAHVAPPTGASHGASVAGLRLMRRTPSTRVAVRTEALTTSRQVARIKAAHASALAGLAGAGFTRLASATTAKPGAGALALAGGDTLRIDVNTSETLQVVVSGDQPVRVVAIDGAGWPLLDAVLQRPIALPRGTAHVLTQGFGRDRLGAANVPSDGGFVAETPLVPAIGGTWVGPRCVVSVLGGAAPDGAPRRAAPLLASASEVRVWLPAVEGSLVVVFDDAAAAAAGGLRVYSPDLHLGAPFAVHAGRRVALVYTASVAQIWRLDLVTKGRVGLAAVRALASPADQVAARLGADWSWLAPAPARPFGSSRVQIARRSDV